MSTLERPWDEGDLPANVRAGANTIINGRLAFKRFLATGSDALVIGDNCTMDGVHFALHKDGRVRIGDYCHFTSALLLCEMGIQIGSYVIIGWNTVIADSDFHPIEPALRIADAVACSPLGKGRRRPPIVCKPVIIEDDVWIGPNCAILKGVQIGAGSFIEPGSVVTSNVPAGSRIRGNPAQVVGGA